MPDYYWSYVALGLLIAYFLRRLVKQFIKKDTDTRLKLHRCDRCGLLHGYPDKSMINNHR